MRMFIILALAVLMLFNAGCKPRTSPVASLDVQPLPEQSAESKGVPFPVPAPEVKPEPAVFHNTIAGQEEALNAALDRISTEYHVMGMSIAAFEKDRIVYRHSFGIANVETGMMAGQSTKYRVASVSKLVTTMLTLSLMEQTDHSVDDDLREQIPLIKNPYFPDDKITARQLMTHTSGFYDGTGYLNNKGGSFPSLSRVFEIGGMCTGNRPGEKYLYSNFGLGLLCAEIESITGERFYDYAEEKLFDPLGIDAAYTVSLIQDKAAIASIYQDGVLQAAPSTWGNMSAAYTGIPIGQMYLLGHGDLVISAEDLARIGIILAGNGSYEGKTYISPKSLALINSVQFTDDTVTRGMGSMVISGILPEQLFGHQGNAYGMISCIFYDPKSQTGVVFLTNGSNTSKDDAGVYNVNREVMQEVWKYLV